MKFRVFSDIHLDFNRDNLWFPKELPEDKDTVLFLVGDFNVAPFRDRTVEWLTELGLRFKNVVGVLGNHDYWGSDNWGSEPYILDNLLPSNVYILEKTSITIDDIRIGGCTLWTNMDNDPAKISFARAATNDLARIKGMKAQDWIDEFIVAKDWIITNPVDILLTHYVPMRKFTTPRFMNSYENYMFSSDIGQDMINYYHSMPKYWLFGHTHSNFKEKILGTTFICNPKGYHDENFFGFDHEALYEY